MKHLKVMILSLTLLMGITTTVHINSSNDFQTAEINVCRHVIFLSFPNRQFDFCSFFRTNDSLVPIYDA
ncbi:hypothetical protein, partial [Bacillus safensis]|uniref:hypothetical protein n=1 Tax=Bacillus safensis TaxID=561879 RepID=UPI0033961373